MEAWQWASLVALGLFHGLNPAMGWLFAVAIGLQERRVGAVLEAMGFIALGHTLAIGAGAGLTVGLGFVVPRLWLALGVGLTLVGYAAYRLWRRLRHPTWARFRMRRLELVGWSFLMAFGHGAPLMLAPLMLVVASPVATFWATALHSLVMWGVASGVAWWVFRVVGVGFLRTAWVNLELIWVFVLLMAGLLTIGYAFWR